MRYGIYLANFGWCADPTAILELAHEAERAGWDGFFIYDHVIADAQGARPGDWVVDPWVALASIAATTTRLLLGPLVTPLARRRPWKVAREVATLDRLSNGKVILGVGLGTKAGFSSFGEEHDDRIRAEKLDEALDVLTACFTGSVVHHDGKHYTVEGVDFLPTPLQHPRVPVWVGGIWPNRSPFRRAARWEGAFPIVRESALISPAELIQIRDYIARFRTREDAFDLVITGPTKDCSDTKYVEELASAGATWWLELLKPARGSFEESMQRVKDGPPRIEGVHLYAGNR